ncbi:MAG: helix-turn-helix transcriptional regulator [Lentisphaeria bacterium]|nr:helix-turn-helix transcriptional regulator [Lentisphaeria bacterium]
MMQNIHHYIMASPYHSTDFFVRGTGHFIIQLPEPEKKAHFAEIFWCINGSGIFYLDGEKYRLKPKSIFYYPPGSQQCFLPENQFFDYRWLSIDGPNAGMLFKSLGYKKGLLSAGDCPEDLFLRLERYLENDIKEFQLKALNVAFEILTSALVPKGNTRPVVEQVREFMDENYHDPGVHINMLAEAFHIHRVSLNRLFQQKYGLSPIQYLTSVRIRQGIRLLCSTEETVKEIAFRCGYNSADYFSKCIFKQSGMLPETLRKKVFPAFPPSRIRTAEVPEGCEGLIRRSENDLAGTDPTLPPLLLNLNKSEVTFSSASMRLINENESDF